MHLAWKGAHLGPGRGVPDFDELVTRPGLEARVWGLGLGVQVRFRVVLNLV